MTLHIICEFQSMCVKHFETQSVVQIDVCAFFAHLRCVLVTMRTAVLFHGWNTPVIQSIISDSIRNTLVRYPTCLTVTCCLWQVCVLHQVRSDNCTSEFQKVKRLFSALVSFPIDLPSVVNAVPTLKTKTGHHHFLDLIPMR